MPLLQRHDVLRVDLQLARRHTFTLPVGDAVLDRVLAFRVRHLLRLAHTRRGRESAALHLQRNRRTLLTPWRNSPFSSY